MKSWVLVLATVVIVLNPGFIVVKASTGSEKTGLAQITTEFRYLIKDVQEISSSVGLGTADEKIELSRLAGELEYIRKSLEKLSTFRREDDFDAFAYEDHLQALVTFRNAIERHLKKSVSSEVLFNYQRLIEDIRREIGKIEAHLEGPSRNPRSVRSVKLENR